jgi:hypothetical protein
MPTMWNLFKSRFIDHNRLLYLAVLFLFFTCQSCSWLEPPVASGAVLFQDDFSRPTSGWDRYRDDTYISDYVDDAYHISIFAPETNVWSRPHLEFSDIRIQVAVTKVEGPDDNVFGVLCRYQDAFNFYFFLISSDGFGGIGVFKDGKEELLSGESLLPSETISQGSATNIIQAECIGDQLRLNINGGFTAQAEASEWSRGDVGLIAGTYDQPGAEIRFEKFSVIQP